MRPTGQRVTSLHPMFGAGAARLRYEEATILAAAKSVGLDVDKVSVRVARVDYNDND